MSQQPGFQLPGFPRPGIVNQQDGNAQNTIPGSQGFMPGGVPPPQPGVTIRAPGGVPMMPRPGIPPQPQPHPVQSQLPRPGMPIPRPQNLPQTPNMPGTFRPPIIPPKRQVGVPGIPTPNSAQIPGPSPNPAQMPGPSPISTQIPGPSPIPTQFPGPSPLIPGQVPPRPIQQPTMPQGGQTVFQPGAGVPLPPGSGGPPQAPGMGPFVAGPRPHQFGAPKGVALSAGAVGQQQVMGFTSAAAEQLLSQVEQISLGPATPGGDAMVDPNSLPRPVGDSALAARVPGIEAMKGSCHSSFMRMTVGCIPQSQAVRSRWQLPLGILVQPLSDSGVIVPVISPGVAGIMRCRRCRTYINPFVQWTDGGRRWKCNVCTMMNEVPNCYYCSVDEYGQRRDVNERPELSLGSVEYVAPEEYMVRAPMPPSYFFLIDVSVSAVQSGVLQSICDGIRDSLDFLPGGERTRVGFMTFDRSLHFYNLRSSAAMPQMMVVGEVDEPFVPIPDDLLVDLAENRNSVGTLLQQLPSSFSGVSAPVDSTLGPALQAALMVISGIGGKLVVFQTGIPSLGAGKITNRENVKLYGSDREHNLRNPEDSFFKNVASECNRAQITVDLFTFCSQYVDLASLSSIPKYTCGSVHYYPGFNPGQSNRLKMEIKKLLGKEIAWEAVMRIRSSRGLSITNFLGHFFVRSSDLLALPTADQDKTFAASIKHEESILADQVAYIQCALLYTASCGERRIRVHTLAVPVATDLNEMYRTLDGGATAAMMAKLGVEKSYSSKLEECRQAVLQKVMLGFKEFRLLHSQHFRAPNQLAFPPGLKFLPAQVLGITKSSALRAQGRDSIPDERIAVGFEIMQASVDQVLTIAYPNIYRIDNLQGDWGREKPAQNNGATKVDLPPTLPASFQILDHQGVYLMDNGRVFVLWLGRNVNAKIYQDLFDVSPPVEPQNMIVEPARASELSQRLNSLLTVLRQQRSAQQQCFVVISGSPVEAHILPLFVEDRGVGSESLLDCLQNIQRSAMKM